MRQKQDLIQALRLTEHNTGYSVILDLETVQGDDFFAHIGEWTMKSLTYFHEECRLWGYRPNIDFDTVSLTRPAYNTILVGAFLDDLGILH